MNRKVDVVFLLWFLCLLTGLGRDVVQGQQAEYRDSVPNEEVSANDKSILLNFQDASLRTILDYLSEVAGFIIVTDLDIPERLTVISRQPVSTNEVVSLLNSCLLEHNYAAILQNRVLKVVALEQAKQMNIPVRSGNNAQTVVPGDDMVTHVIPVRYADATELEDELQNLISPFADITSNEETNTLVITDTTANVRRFIEIVTAMDSQVTGSTSVRVYHLLYSDARSTADLINTIFQGGARGSAQQQDVFNPFDRFRFGRGGDGGGRGGRDNNNRGNEPGGIDRSQVVAAADEYTNSLVVTGPGDILEIIDEMIEDLDSNPQQEQSVMVYPLQNARADNLKEVLNNLFQEMERILTQGTSNTDGGGGGRGGFFGGGANNSRTSTDASTTAGDLVGQVYIEADVDTNSLIVIAASRHFDKMRRIIADLDKPVPQVLIKVLIAEITHDGSLDVGVEFSLLNLRDSGGSTLTLTDFGLASQANGLLVGTVEGDLDVTLAALETEGKLDILSRPYILTSNNQPATITVGEEVPFIRNTRLTETGQTINTIEYEDIGIILEVTPSINPEGLVIMDVSPEISTTTAKTVPISETVDAAVFAKRASTSRVAIRDGQTIVVGGLVQDQETESIRKVPLLGDVPLLGALFRRTIIENSKTELLIFLTPYVAMEDRYLSDITENEKRMSEYFGSETSEIFSQHMDAMTMNWERQTFP